MTDKTESHSFPKPFWLSNSLAFLEKAAFFAMAPLFIVYLNENLGMNPIQSALLNGSLLWGLICFLPLVNQRLLPLLGLKQALGISFVSMSLGYFVLGYIQRIWPRIVGAIPGGSVDYTVPVILGILLIASGTSLARSGSAGSLKESLAGRITLGMGILFLTLHAGAITGRVISYPIRTRGLKLFPVQEGVYLIQVDPSMSTIFSCTAIALSLLGLMLVVLLFRDPPLSGHGDSASGKPRLKRRDPSLTGLKTVLKSRRYLHISFHLFFFWVLYAQLFNLFPLYLRFIDPSAPVELYTLTIPVTLLSLHLMVIRLIRKWSSLKAMVLGVTLSILGMLINIVPLVMTGEISRNLSLWRISIPLAGLFMVISFFLVTIGEIILSSRMISHFNRISPGSGNGDLTLHLKLPMVLGVVAGSPLGGFLFQRFIDFPVKSGLSPRPLFIWMILALLGVFSIFSVMLTPGIREQIHSPESQP